MDVLVDRLWVGRTHSGHPVGEHHWLRRRRRLTTEHTHTHTHTHPFNGPFSGLPRWAGTRKVKPIWILLKKETASGNGTSWAICKYAPRSRQITTPAPHYSVFYRPYALPAAQPTASKHWRNKRQNTSKSKFSAQQNKLLLWTTNSNVARI